MPNVHKKTAVFASLVLTDDMRSDKDDIVLLQYIIQPAREARGPNGPVRWER